MKALIADILQLPSLGAPPRMMNLGGWGGVLTAPSPLTSFLPKRRPPPQATYHIVSVAESWGGRGGGLVLGDMAGPAHCNQLQAEIRAGFTDRNQSLLGPK